MLSMNKAPGKNAALVEASEIDRNKRTQNKVITFHKAQKESGEKGTGEAMEASKRLSETNECR